MIWLFLFLALVMVGLVVLTVEFLIPNVIIALGKQDKWWSPIRIFPPPGEMFIVVRGTPNGPFDRVVEAVLDFSFNESKRTFVPDTNLPQETYLRKLGVTWIGFFRYLLHREVRHDKWEQLPEKDGKLSTEFGIVSKVRPGPSIFFRYNMAVHIKAAETLGNFPVDAVLVFTAQIMNPVKAFFFAGGWEVQVAAAVQGKFRKYVSDKNIDELRTEQKTGADLVTTEIKNLSLMGPDGKTETGLLELFGVEIVDARFVFFDLVSGDRDEEMIKATRALEIARLLALADAEKGQGQGNMRKNRAAGIQAEVEAWGTHPVGATVVVSEVLKDNDHLTSITYAPGAGTMVPLGK